MSLFDDLWPQGGADQQKIRAPFIGLPPATGGFLDAAEHIGRCPDVVGLGGWRIAGGSGQKSIGAGYHGVSERLTPGQRRRCAGR
jgi:hypothetical protein